MQRASNLFNEQQRKQVEHAIVEAESKTSCEIVPVVATASGRYDRAEDVIGLWLAVIAAVAVWLLFPRIADDAGSWSGTSLLVGVLTMIAAVAVSFVAGAIIGSKVGGLRRLFIPRQQLLDEVAARAREVFFDKRVHHTAGATGMLIYVSLYEHTAIVLGDQEVLDKLGQTFLDGLCQQLTQGLRQHNPTETLCSVIAEAGTQLSEPLPREAGDVNELQDSLILID
jgi:putative membrane protein